MAAPGVALLRCSVSQRSWRALALQPLRIVRGLATRLDMPGLLACGRDELRTYPICHIHSLLPWECSLLPWECIYQDLGAKFAPGASEPLSW